jgi:hypothetical protein
MPDPIRIPVASLQACILALASKCTESGLRCKQEGQHRRERERNKQLASDVKNRDDERRQQNHPDPYKRGGRGILHRSHGMSSVVHSAATGKCAARHPRTADSI